MDEVKKINGIQYIKRKIRNKTTYHLKQDGFDEMGISERQYLKAIKTEKKKWAIDQIVNALNNYLVP